MGWTEQDHKQRTPLPMTQERAKELEAAKADGLPRIQKESEEAKPFDPMRFQPVQSPNIYEAEFAVKGSDIIFHFWPWGYHAADRDGKATPRFGTAFLPSLKAAMADSFTQERVEITFDGDVGSYFVKARGWGENGFHYELSVKACEKLHKLLGGES